MLTNLELYGTEDVPKVPRGVCDKRIGLLRNRLGDLLSVHFMSHDNNSINEVQKAIKFWQQLRDGENP